MLTEKINECAINLTESIVMACRELKEGGARATEEELVEVLTEAGFDVCRSGTNQKMPAMMLSAEFMGSKHDKALHFTAKQMTFAFINNWDACPDGINRIEAVVPLFMSGSGAWSIISSKSEMAENVAINAILQTQLDLLNYVIAQKQ